MVAIVSGFTEIGDSKICWPLNEYIKEEETRDLLGLNNEMHTESVWTRLDLDWGSPKAWPNILAIKLQTKRSLKLS